MTIKKKAKEIPSSDPVNKSYNIQKKNEPNKKLEDTKIDKKSKLSVKTDSSKDLKKDSTGNSQDTKNDDSSSKNTDQNEFIEKLVQY